MVNITVKTMFRDLMQLLSPFGGGRGRVSTLEGQTPLLIFKEGRGWLIKLSAFS